MVVKLFKSSSIDQLQDLINDFTETIRSDHSYTIDVKVVPAANFLITNDYSGSKENVFTKEYFIAVIQY